MQVRRIVVDSSYASIWRELMEGISLFVRERRAPWQIHFAGAAEFAAAIAQRPDGILSVLPRDATPLLDAIKKSRAPAVNMLRNAHPLLPSVVTDNTTVGERAAEYFLGRGFRHFGFVGPDREWSTARFTGFQNRLAAEKIEPHRQSIPVTVQELRAVKNRPVLNRLKRWIESLPRPVAILAASDFVARTVVEACLESGTRVPEHAAVLGVDNEMAICEFSPVSLSSVPQNFARIGFEAARLLDGLMSGRRQPRGPLRIPPREIVVRQSTDVIAVADPLIAHALHLIHHGTDERVDVKALLSELRVSRQWLDRQFKAVLGRTASEEIRNLRLARARAMLLETRLSIKQIAARTGFSNAENFCRFFRQLTGEAPTDYRRGRGA